MSPLARPALAALALAVLTSGAAAGAQGGGATEANPTCSSATAVLLTGDGNDEAARWSMIRKAVDTLPRVKIVPEAPQNRVEEVALVRFDVRHTYAGGPTAAYTVQCGHGGTCNDVANAFRKEFPAITPAPVVLCGDVSHALSNPRPAP